MAETDARVEYLEYELKEREKEQKKMAEGEKTPQMTEDRIRDLEGKLKEIEALVKGLTDEMLDLKSILMKLSARDEERRAVMPVPRMPSEVTVRPRRPTAVAEPKKPEAKESGEMELIMQTDGTLKPERRSESNNFIVASTRYNPNIGMKGKGKGKIISEEEPKKEASDLIYAVDEDPKKKK
jgi:hypothetical protein